MFTHLHVRSWFSWLDGGSSPAELAERARSAGMTTLALTDRNGVYGAVRFQRACREQGIKGIIGSEVTVDGEPLVLLAASAGGYANLCRIITAAHLASREEPSAPLACLAECSGDLFCLTGGRGARLARLVEKGSLEEARAWLGQLREVFGAMLFVELTHQLRRGDSALNRRLRGLALEEGVPIVAASDVRYAAPEHYRRHDLLTCIRTGTTIFDRHPERPTNAEAYLRSEEDLRRIIPFPEAFDNAARIADACELNLIRGYVIPPATRLYKGISPRAFLSELCLGALLERYAPRKRERAEEQLRKELATIATLGLEEFFLVVREVVVAAREMGIRCAGRGSAANSIVAYLLGITGVDPIRHNLLFERFLHGGRKGTPDIDVDFDADRRPEVIAWMEERFGIEQTAMTANVVTYQLRMALRDVAKALGYPPHIIDRMAGVMPHHRAEGVVEFREALTEAAGGESPLLELLIEMIRGLDGCPRHLSLHSGGMLLSRTPLHEFTPVQVSANGVKVGQFDKEDVEALGLIKLDVLALRMLAAVSEAVELVRRHEGIELDVDALPLDDPATFELIRSGSTLGLFQIESQGQIHLLAQHQPEDFDDLISEIALFRPGPLQSGMVNPFIRRRRGLEPVRYGHPKLEPLLRDTYGIILFQEQVLEVAHKFAGMSLQEADDFRALMSKFRDPGEMEGMREKFVRGAMGNGVDEPSANDVFDTIAHFVGFGFCRSHAAAFAKTVYQSAWLKRHHPAAFMAAIMQHRPGMYNLMTLEEEARRFGASVLLPSINASGIRYELERTPEGTLAIRKPLAIIAGISAEHVRAIALYRLEGGAFTSVEDLCRRVTLPRDVLDELARSGALDELAGSSRRALWEIGVALRRLPPRQERLLPSLFDLPLVEPEDVPDLPELTAGERLSWDYATHRAARHHPMILLRRTLIDLEVRPIATAYRLAGSRLRPAGSPHPKLTVAGIAVLRQMPPTAKGVMFITLEDETGYIQCVVHPATRERLPALLGSSALIVSGEVHITGNWRGIVVKEAWALEGMIGGYIGFPSAHGGTDRHVIELEPPAGETGEAPEERTGREGAPSEGARREGMGEEIESLPPRLFKPSRRSERARRR